MNTLFLLSLCALSYLLVGALIRVAPRLGLADIPNARSSHNHHCVRGGGLVFVLLWLLSVGLVVDPQFRMSISPVLIAALLVAAIGFWDDMAHVHPRWRFVVHLGSAAIAALALTDLSSISLGIASFELGGLLFPTAVLAIAWSINLFNFMDGTDGLAALEALVIFCCAGLMFLLSDPTGFANSQLMLVCITLVASVTGFFVWNFPRAKIFMGDVGSGFLGLLIPVIALLGELYCNVPALVWLILYGLFWSDALFTLVRRIIRGEKFYEAHRQHAYQRLHHVARLSHRHVLIVYFCANSILMTFAWIGFIRRDLLPFCVGLAILFCCLYYLGVEVVAPLNSRRRQQSAETPI